MECHEVYRAGSKSVPRIFREFFRAPAAILLLMHGLRGVLAVAVCASALAAEAPSGEYRARREAARKTLSNAVLVLFGRTADQMDERSNGPLQDPDFYYLTGWTEPGAILMLTTKEDLLFLPAHNPANEVYTGPLAAASDENVHSVTGFEKVLPVTAFETQFSKALEYIRPRLHRDRRGVCRGPEAPRSAAGSNGCRAGPGTAAGDEVEDGDRSDRAQHGRQRPGAPRCVASYRSRSV